MTAAYTYGTSLIRKDGETPLFDGLGSERTVTNAGQAMTVSRLNCLTPQGHRTNIALTKPAPHAIISRGGGIAKGASSYDSTVCRPRDVIGTEGFRFGFRGQR